MKRARISLSSLAIAGLIGAGLSAAPIGFDDQFAPEFKSAFAKGKGSGKSGGKGGKGGGHGHSGSNHGADLEKSSDDKIEDGDGSGKGHLKAKGNGHVKHQHGDGDEDHDGAHPSSLGNLNAAHASPNARLHASGNSIVGLLAAYADAVNSEEGLTLDEARAALGAISNKSYLDPELENPERDDPEADESEPGEEGGVAAVDAEVVMEVNALLGVNDLQEDPDGEDDDEEAAN